MCKKEFYNSYKKLSFTFLLERCLHVCKRFHTCVKKKSSHNFYNIQISQDNLSL